MINRKTTPIPYEVIEEIEILREFAFGIIADIINIKENENDNSIIKFLTEIEDYVSNLYSNMFKIFTLKEAYICRGKLQAINEILKSHELKG